jgi:hypothetical protein
MVMRLAVLLAMVSIGCSTNDADILPDSGDNGDDLDIGEADIPPDQLSETDLPAVEDDAGGGETLYDIGPRCPPEVMPTTPRADGVAYYGPQYPMTYVEVITGADAVPAEPNTPFTARWTGIRRLATPITRSCLDAFVTDPPGIPCQVDTVIELTMTDDTLVEILVGLAFEDLAPFADGRAVSVLLGRTADVPVAEPSPTRELGIREGETGPLLLAVASSASVHGPGEGSTWDDIATGFGNSGCVAERDSCLRVFVSGSLVVTTPGGESTLEPGESVLVPSRGFTYRVTHRRSVARVYYVFPHECTDISADMRCAEMVRMP